MKKIKLIKRSQNVNYTFDADGVNNVATATVQSAEFDIVVDETNIKVGMARAYTGSLNVEFYGGIQSAEVAQKIIEDMVSGIVLPDDAAGTENDGEE